MSTVAEVRLWGRTIGAVAQLGPDDSGPAAAPTFEYAPDFATSGIEVAPLAMPLSTRLYEFPELAGPAFQGLPGLLADSLPDRFGTALVDAWLASQGRAPGSLGAVERLCYTGRRGMGALEFAPTLGPPAAASVAIEVAALVELASAVLAERAQLHEELAGEQTAAALTEILRVGTSAGGARAKAVIAWNPTTNEVRSGQLGVDPGFEHWLLKFDGVRGTRDRELSDPRGFGAIELAYAHMARAAGIHMSPCRLLEEGGRRHFMTRRFDRGPDGSKLHMQTLAAMRHLDFNLAGAHSYEQALLTIRELGLPMEDLEEQLRRMVFNVLARNQDDHVKNIAFLMDKRGEWQLAPAYDLTYAFNPEGEWTAQHQMSIAGKRDEFTREDIHACARSASLARGRVTAIIEAVRSAVADWPRFAEEAGVPATQRNAIQRTFRQL